MAHEQLVGGIDVLGRSLTTLRIIVFALAAGVITFAGFVISQNLGKPHTLGGALNPMSTTLLAGGLIALVLGFVLPRLLFGSGRNLPINPPPGLTPEQLKMVTPDLVRLERFSSGCSRQPSSLGPSLKGARLRTLWATCRRESCCT